MSNEKNLDFIKSWKKTKHFEQFDSGVENCHLHKQLYAICKTSDVELSVLRKTRFVKYRGEEIM